PEQRWGTFVIGLAMERDCRLWHVAPVRLLDCLGHGQHTVDRRLERTGQFACDHLRGSAVVAEDRKGRALVLNAYDITKLNDATLTRQSIGGHRCCQCPFAHHFFVRCGCKTNRDGMATAAPVRVTDNGAGVERAHRIVDVRLLDAMILEVVLINSEPHALSLDAEGVVYINYERNAFESF